MARINGNILLHGASGHIGKQVVIKQYAYGKVLSKFPNMSNIKPSKKQEEKRSKFSDAVAFAKGILKDAAKKTAYKKKLKPGQTVYHAALKEYLLLN